WTTYSAQRNGKTEMFVRWKYVNQGKEQQISTYGSASLTPALGTTSMGNICAAWQVWTDQGGGIAVTHTDSANDGRNGWDHKFGSPKGAAKRRNFWHPVLAASPNGDVALAHDG